jgi:hypothetical protein
MLFSSRQASGLRNVVGVLSACLPFFLEATVALAFPNAGDGNGGDATAIDLVLLVLLLLLPFPIFARRRKARF